MCWWGRFDRNKKERSYIQPQPTCVVMWKVRCTSNIQEVYFAVEQSDTTFKSKRFPGCCYFYLIPNTLDHVVALTHNLVLLKLYLINTEHISFATEITFMPTNKQ